VKKRFSEEQIIGFLREALSGKGKARNCVDDLPGMLGWHPSCRTFVRVARRIVCRLGRRRRCDLLHSL
jgi:hypothetical protein